MSIELKPGALYTLKDKVMVPIYRCCTLGLVVYEYINSGMYATEKHILFYIKRYKSAPGIPCHNEYYEFLYKGTTKYLKIEDLVNIKRL